MNNLLKNKLIIATATLVLLSGCKTTEPLYYHGQYNNAVYSYFKAEDNSVLEQIQIIEELIQKAAAKGKNVAPGVHAHLGMLFFEVGNEAQGIEHFNKEKELFPESNQYIDFLLKSAKGV